MNKLPTLYSKTKHGQIQVWEIYVDEDQFFTKEGILNGVMTESKPTKCLPKNEGKKNETTGQDQAQKEAEAKHKKKLDRDYRLSVEELDNGVFEEPMLAQKYKEYVEKKGSVFGKDGYVYVSAKLDGMRCVVNSTEMKSREGKTVISAPHIREALVETAIAEMNEEFYKSDSTIEIDGEMYCHKFSKDFNKVISLAKKTKPTPEELEESKQKLEYHIYDIRGLPNNPTYSERLKIVKKLVEDCNANGYNFIKFVDGIKVTKSEEIEEYFEKWLEESYEGLMIRFDTPYVCGRTWNLLKYKEFIDAEFKIIDVLEGIGNRAGMAAKILCEHEGRQFGSNLRGNIKFRKEFFNNKSDYIGLMATIRYQNITPLKDDGTGGVPRIGVMTKLRTDSGSDIPINLY